MRNLITLKPLTALSLALAAKRDMWRAQKELDDLGYRGFGWEPDNAAQENAVMCWCDERDNARSSWERLTRQAWSERSAKRQAREAA